MAEYYEISLLSEKETQDHIVSVTKHEYFMKQRPVKQIELLLYIQFLWNFQTTIQDRSESKNIQLPKALKFTIIQKIHSLFQRGIRVFSNDQRMWLQYIAFCKEFKANTKLKTIFGNAIQMFPHSPIMWSEMILWVYENQGMDSARRLALRGIRATKKEPLVHLTYLKIECDFYSRNRQILPKSVTTGIIKPILKSVYSTFAKESESVKTELFSACKTILESFQISLDEDDEDSIDVPHLNEEEEEGDPGLDEKSIHESATSSESD